MKKSEKKKKKKTNEYIAVSGSKKSFTIRKPFSEEVSINNKKFDPKIMEDENGFTYIEFNKKKYLVEISEKNQNKYTVLINGVGYHFSIETPISYKRKKVLDKQSVKSKTETVSAPMPGKIVDIMVEENTDVSEGDAILILEAMKMQNEINSPISGKIKKILIKQNDTVLKDDALIEIDLN